MKLGDEATINGYVWVLYKNWKPGKTLYDVVAVTTPVNQFISKCGTIVQIGHFYYVLYVDGVNVVAKIEEVIES